MWKAYKQINNPPKVLNWEYVEDNEMLPEENFEINDNMSDTTNITNINNISNDIKKIYDIDYSKYVNSIYNKEHVFFIGRGIDYYLSLEGSLKLKEISYIHAESYAAGELKHGTISLIEEGTPVIAIITDKSLASKTISNIKEVLARGAYVILICNESINVDNDIYNELITIPDNNYLTPILAIISMQLLSYYVAKKRDCDIDKPKNLAKSVTVE